GVDAIGFGLVTLRRPVSGKPTLRRVEDLLGPLESPVGEHVAACLAAHDWLEAHDDDALLRARLRVAGDVTEERYHRPGEEDPTVVLLRQGGGFGRVVRASTALAGLVGACDGELTVGQIVAALAQLLDEPVGEHVAACLAAHDWLEAHDDDALLQARLRVAEDVTEERYHRPGDEDPTVVLLRQGGGFGRVVQASAALAGLVGACDGELTVGQIVAALAQLLDEPVGALTGRLLPAVRGLVADGLLLF
ncbi:MAG: DUF7782 domain-containing protein, partial [Actinomycetes bacterium]